MLLPFLLVPVLASFTAATSPTEASGHHCAAGNTEEMTSLLRLVNKSDETVLDAQWAPDDMVSLAKDHLVPGAKGALRAEAADAVARMLEAGKVEGHELLVRSAFRSYKKQGRIFQNKSHRYGLESASRRSARAGHSQHQLGTTVDIVLPRYRNRITQRIAKSSEYEWLVANAHRFGFALSYPRGKEELTGYMFEPWHYRYVGIAAATEMWEQDTPMETYLRTCRDGE